eukprot:m.53641 g.53641  ORF g.53641 m.53641 type:complete len:523 (-) comp21792_c1_seq1:55-1623(-)
MDRPRICSPSFERLNRFVVLISINVAIKFADAVDCPSDDLAACVSTSCTTTEYFFQTGSSTIGVSGICANIQNCSEAYPLDSTTTSDLTTTTYRESYEISANTFSSDRLCAPCLECTYVQSPCTATTDTVCTSSTEVSTPVSVVIGAVAGVILCSLVFYLFVRYRRKRKTLQTREMTQLLLNVSDLQTSLESSEDLYEFVTADDLYSEEQTDTAAILLQKATQFVVPDMIEYNLVWGEYLQEQGTHAQVQLDEAVDEIDPKMAQGTLHQPKLELPNNPTPQDLSQYFRKLTKEFETYDPDVTHMLEQVASTHHAQCRKGPNKTKDRVFQKSMHAYNWDLTRITDYRRFSIVCSSFATIETVLKDIAAQGSLKLLRIKNRFSPNNTNPKDTAGYRDLQICVEYDNTGLIYEIQLHLDQFFKKKHERAQKNIGGLSGHDRYVHFRDVKEQIQGMHNTTTSQTVLNTAFNDGVALSSDHPNRFRDRSQSAPNVKLTHTYQSSRRTKTTTGDRLQEPLLEDDEDLG